MSENIDFIEDVNKYKNVYSFIPVTYKTIIFNNICRKYILYNAEKEILLPNEIRDNIINTELGPLVFDRALGEIIKDLKNSDFFIKIDNFIKTF